MSICSGTSCDRKLSGWYGNNKLVSNVNNSKCVKDRMKIVATGFKTKKIV